MKRDISKLIKTQAPRFVAKEYPLFIKLLEYYYKFNQDQGLDIPFEDVRHPSKTKQEFKELLLKEYGYGLPIDVVASDKFDDDFILQLKDLYSRKGTDDSIKELFDKVLPLILNREDDDFTSDVEIDRPFDRVLRVSDGRWITNSSIFVKYTEKYKDVETMDLVVDHAIHTNRLNGEATKFYPYRSESVVFYEDGGKSKTVRKGYLQLFTKDNIDFNIGDIVTIIFTDGSEVVSTITSNTSKIIIEDGGENFKPNELVFVPIADLEGNEYKGLVIRVTTVDDRGSILEFDILNFAVDVPYEELLLDVGNVTDAEESINILSKPTKYGHDFWISIINRLNIFSDYGRIEHRYVDRSIKSALYFGFIEYDGYSFENGLFYWDKLANAKMFEDAMSIREGEYYTDGTKIFKSKSSGIWILTDMDHEEMNQSVNGVEYELICDYYRDEFNFLTKTRNFGDYRYGSVINQDSFDNNLGKPGFLGKSQNKNARLRIFSIPLAKYNGYYESGVGLLDDISKLQDDGENNQFAYVLYSETDPRSYRDIVDKTVHPVGNIRFSKKVVYNEFTDNVEASSAVELSNRRMVIMNMFEVLDASTNDRDLFAKYIIKPLHSVVNVPDIFDRIFHGIRERYELVFFKDGITKHIDKRIEEMPNFDDFVVKITTKMLQTSFKIYDEVRKQTIKGTYFSEIFFKDYIRKEIQKTLNDKSIINDEVFKDFSKYLYSNGVIDDRDYKHIVKGTFEESATFFEFIAKRIDKDLLDKFIVTESIHKKFTLAPIKDSFNIKGLIKKGIDKGIVFEYVKLQLLFEKHLEKKLIDNILMSDDILKDIDRELIDYVDIDNNIIKKYIKPLYTTYTMDDLIEKHIGKTMFDRASIYDMMFKGVNKPIIDLLNVHDHNKMNIDKNVVLKMTIMDDEFIKTLDKGSIDEIIKSTYTFDKFQFKKVIETPMIRDGGYRLTDYGERGYWDLLDRYGYDADIQDKYREKFGDIKIDYEIEEFYFGFTDVLDDKGKPYYPMNVGLWTDYKEYI